MKWGGREGKREKGSREGGNEGRRRVGGGRERGRSEKRDRMMKQEKFVREDRGRRAKGTCHGDSFACLLSVSALS